MSKVSGMLTGKRRNADRAQAQRIFKARREMDQAFHRPGGPNRETSSGIERSRAVWQRTDANGSPRAKKQADHLYARTVTAKQRSRPKRGRAR